MRATYSTRAGPLTALLCALSLLTSVLAVAMPEPNLVDIDIDIDLGDLGNLTARPICDQYSFIANYSTIGANATMRDALQNASPHGAELVANVVKAAMKVADYFTHNQVINKMCGNLSSVAGQAAAANFSNGIVAGQVVDGKGLGAGARVGNSLVLVMSLSLVLVLVVG
ncbi:hypothetical protein PG993_010241 [Apiospora rasikravindrae]|uniref:Uncharacterized protein n=1 Tax=Apiospora rasikravindrae TaxID=990691 RepID=A0ABR1SLR3_9PEZI